MLDFFYQQAIRYGYGPKASSQIVYLTVSDDTYQYFGKNILDRADLAVLNDVLGKLAPQAVAYDIIFAYPSHTRDDEAFAQSITRLGNAYLPIAFDISQQARPFRWKDTPAYALLRDKYLKAPLEKGKPHPFSATRALMQWNAFAEAATGSGHITTFSDPDGVYRHYPMIVKVDSYYFPALTLSMFLDYEGVPFESVTIDWGREIRIPATKDSWLDRDVVIPIDNHGRAFIPYVQTLNRDFKHLSVHTLLQHANEKERQGNLAQFFEGRFVFIGDVSAGISDIGHTPLEDNVPLITLHAALMNGLLTNTFYQPWSTRDVLIFICVLGLVLGLAALPKTSGAFYVAGGVMFFGILVWTWLQFIQFSLFPIFTVGSSFLFIFFGLIIGMHVITAKNQAFIRNAFAKYVPEKVVNELIDRPELLQLGGIERELSVLFSDIEGFTMISERMSPSDLVALLNEYLTEMTNIILAEGGIIDKYEGDAIMAEFGVPIPTPQHADLAVRAGLNMQRRLLALGEQWAKRNLPVLRCRIGINTGRMVVGNMGSQQVFDYTVIGDAANLASRLESANKHYATTLMISEFTYAQLTPGMFRTRILDVIKVQGKSQAVKVFEVYGDETEAIQADEIAYYQTYHGAFEAYLARHFAQARAQFELALAIWPTDLAAQTMLARLDALDPDDIPDDWDGAVALTSK